MRHVGFHRASKINRRKNAGKQNRKHFRHSIYVVGGKRVLQGYAIQNSFYYPTPQTISQDQIEKIRQKAIEGDPENQLYLGVLYANGQFGEIRFDKAAEVKLARDEEAFWRAYYAGDPVFQDENNVIRHMQAVVEKTGSHEAQFSLAQLYLGIVPEPVPAYSDLDPGRSWFHNREVAVVNQAVDHWLTQAADNGNDYACSILANPSPGTSVGLDPWLQTKPQVSQEDRERYNRVLLTSDEEYLRYVGVLAAERNRMLTAKDMFKKQPGCEEAIGKLAADGNRYAAVWMEAARVRKLEQESQEQAEDGAVATERVSPRTARLLSFP